MQSFDDLNWVKLIWNLDIPPSPPPPNVVIYLPGHIFNHSQLYVVLSIGVSQN